MQPRPYQLEIDRCIEAGWENASKQLVVSTMGSGKTICFAMLVAKFVHRGFRALILVDQDELVNQAVNKIEKVTGLSVAVEKAERHAARDAYVVVASVQSLCRRLDNWPAEHFGLVIADEADKSLAATWQRCLKHFDGTAKVVGFTATPNRGDCRNLGEYYEHIAFEAYFFDFIGSGKWAFDTSAGGARVQKDWVSPIVVQMLPIKIDVGGLTSAARRDFSEAEADAIITPHLEEIARAIQRYAALRRTLIFLPLIQTCERFVEIAASVGLAAANVSGPNIDVHRVLNQLRAGELDVVANSMLLSRGVDIPEVDALMVARVTKSVSLYQQFVGRGTRLAPGKTNLLLLDPLFVGDERMVCRPSTLIARDADEAGAITDELEARGQMSVDRGEQCELDLMLQAISAREKSLLRELSKQRDEKARLFSLDDLSARLHNPELSHFVPVTAEESRPVSEKQMKWLEKIVIDPNGKFFIGRGPSGAKPLDISGVTNEGHASRILSAAFDSKNKGILMASFAVRQRMRQAGHPNWASATEREGRQFFAEQRSAAGNYRKEPEFI